jgi:hypothetical protein
MNEPGSIDPADVARGVPRELLEAVHRLEVATEWFERAFGALLDAHHHTGHAQILLIEAADALRAAGRGDLAERARRVAAIDAVHGRWTYQMVDEYRSHLIEPVRHLDEIARDEITGGVRHCFEADQKRHTRHVRSGTAVHLPGDDGRTPARAPDPDRGAGV